MPPANEAASRCQRAERGGGGRSWGGGAGWGGREGEVGWRLRCVVCGELCSLKCGVGVLTVGHQPVLVDMAVSAMCQQYRVGFKKGSEEVLVRPTLDVGTNWLQFVKQACLLNLTGYSTSCS